MTALGIELLKDAQAQEPGARQASGVRLSGGVWLPAELINMASISCRQLSSAW